MLMCKYSSCSRPSWCSLESPRSTPHFLVVLKGALNATAATSATPGYENPEKYP